MGELIIVTDATFDEEVIHSTLPVLVDFGASWCGPCKRQLPILKKFADDQLNKIKVCKVDVDEAPEMAAKFGIRSVPTLILFNNGVKVQTLTGMQTPGELLKLLDLI